MSEETGYVQMSPTPGAAYVGSGVTYGTDTPIPDRGQIGREVDRLGQLLDEAEKALGVLRERLGGVLVISSNKIGQLEQAVPTLRSDLAGSLAARGDHLANIRDRILETTAEIDL